MIIDLQQRGDICIVRCEGGFATGAEIGLVQSRADDIKKMNCPKVLMDFRKVIYTGSTGIGFVVGVYTSVTRNSGGRFVLVGVQPRVREVLELTRLTAIIPMAEELDSGLAILNAATLPPGSAGA